jgi:hypothetical protein
MNLAATVRTLLVSLLLLLGMQAGAQAPPERYEGLLLPGDYSAPIPVVVNLTEVAGMLLGKVQTKVPIPGEGVIAGGEREAGKCSFVAPLSPGIRINFKGQCLPGTLDGGYQILSGATDVVSRGTAHLNARPADKDGDGGDKEETKRVARMQPALSPLTACLKTNVSCLTNCPQGSYELESLCAGRCRIKHQQCKRAAMQP